MKFYLFSKESCGPCMLVDKYMKSIKDNRTDLIEKIDLEDAGPEPIPQDNLDLAKYFGVTSTPVLIVVDEDGEKLEEFIGGMAITQNIRKTFDKYGVS